LAMKIAFGCDEAAYKLKIEISKIVIQIGKPGPLHMITCQL
jgi:ribose 5-phosphate isomerase RpiB